jgi:hypothetical protein
VERGADINARDNYALRAAASRGYLAVVDYLLEKGDWESKDENSLSALEKLARDGNIPILIKKIKEFMKTKEEQRALEEQAEAETHQARVAVLWSVAKPFVIKRRGM